MTLRLLQKGNIAVNNIDVLETYETPTDSAYATAGLVCLVRRLRSGDTVEEWLTPIQAFTEAFFGDSNGLDVVSAHIALHGVSDGVSGISGSGLAAEASLIRYNRIINNDWDI